MPPDPSPTDVALRDAIRRALAGHEGSYALDFTWSDGANMWFTEVRPTNPATAFLSAAFDGGDTVFWVIGNADIECFPISADEGFEPWVSEIASSVAAGRVRETGFKRDASVRVLSESGNIVISGGPARLPWPWALRRVRHYAAYSPAPLATDPG